MKPAEPSPQATRGQRSAADDVGASLATARPPPMREQPPRVSHASLASRSYRPKSLPRPPPQAVTQLPAVPSHGEFPIWFPRKYRPASGRRRGRPSARARPFFRRIDPTESRFETCTTRLRGVRRSRVKLRRTTGLYPTARDPPATPRVSNVRPSDVPANVSFPVLLT